MALLSPLFLGHRAALHTFEASNALLYQIPSVHAPHVEVSADPLLFQDALAAINKVSDVTVSCVSLSWGEDEASWDDQVQMTPLIRRAFGAFVGTSA